MDSILMYDPNKIPILKWGFNDINNDGIYDTLLTIWNDKKMAFISDDGKLPWSADDEHRDWNGYFNDAFNVGKEPPVIWNEMRNFWGNYTILVDKDNCGRFDSKGDFYYKCIDINGDGKPESEYFHPHVGVLQYSNKVYVSLNGERDMSNLDFQNFSYPNEQRYENGFRYITNVHGSGFFLQNFSKDVQDSWENPIAWYDFDFDGFTNMVMRAADMHLEPPHLFRIGDRYEGVILEFEVAFELNSNTSSQKYHSLDLQLTFYNYVSQALGYRQFVDEIIGLKGLDEARCLSVNMLNTRHETIRRYLPYMDGYKIGTDYEKWDGVWLIFDEDDDDCRWEEMFSKHETSRNSSGDWYPYSDRIGDRIEIDKDYIGKGNLYIGKFDGRLHLYHAEEAFWDIDYLALFKGSIDRADTEEGPEPRKGLRYPRVRYYDNNKNGFIDTIEYTTVEYGDEENTERLERVISLFDYCDEDNLNPDVCELFDPRVDSAISGWKLSTWDGNPLTAKDFEGTSCKQGYDNMYCLYTTVCENMWANAAMLYETAGKYGLNKSENSDNGLKEKYLKSELVNLEEISVPIGYSRHLAGNTRREKYNNGFWLREKVFSDIVKYSGLDRFELEKYYYTGRIVNLCKYIEEHIVLPAVDI